MKYIYPAIFTPEETGFSVRFPDVDGCYTSGETLEEAMDMANDALCLMLYDMEQRGQAIPSATPINSVSYTVPDFVSLVSCDTDWYRRYFDSKAVKKTLSIPAWLNDMATRAGVNFSQTLQDALKAQLHIS